MARHIGYFFSYVVAFVYSFLFTMPAASLMPFFPGPKFHACIITANVGVFTNIDLLNCTGQTLYNSLDYPCFFIGENTNKGEVSLTISIYLMTDNLI